jgi:hypothetical protein
MRSDITGLDLDMEMLDYGPVSIRTDDGLFSLLVSTGLDNNAAVWAKCIRISRFRRTDKDFYEDISSIPATTNRVHGSQSSVL